MNRKDIYTSLLLIFLGVILHFLFRDLNEIVGITSIVVGICYLIRYFISKNNK